MRFFSELPISLLLSSLAIVNAVPVHSTLLTPDNFASLTASGLWFIEFFSPYCGHCQGFAPVWEKLVTETELDTPQVQLAQVDCSLYGDLCGAQSIRGYPTLRMYNDGKDVGAFKGQRALPDLHAFIDGHVAALAPKSPPPEREDPKPQINTAGEVLALSDATFAATLAQGPLFVKFFAPWCGHCKKLAPVWKQLAKHMKGKMNIAEVNCDDHAALCKAYDVQGYPTLVYLTSGGIKSEYNGGRKLDQLKAFAEKASAAGLHAIESETVDTLIAENEVMYLLVHSDNAILDTVQRAAAPLLGSPSIFTTSDPALLARFDIPQTSTWALLAFKDHDTLLPAAILHERSVPTSAPENTIRRWALAHRLPTALELTQDTFQGVMNAPQAPLVVIAAVTTENRDKASRKMREVGKKWRVRTQGSGITKEGGREVVWAWMDAERWKDWMKSMYGIVVDDAEDLDNIRVVVADHKRLVYYDHDPANQRLKITSSKSLFETVEAAAAGRLSYKNSENFIERTARYLNIKMSALEAYVVTYPWRAVFFVFAIAAAVFLVLKRIISDDVSSDYRKVERLD